MKAIIEKIKSMWESFKTDFDENFRKQYATYMMIGVVLAAASYQCGYQLHPDGTVGDVLLSAELILFCPSLIVLTYRGYPLRHKLMLVLCGFGSGTVINIISAIFDVIK